MSCNVLPAKSVEIKSIFPRIFDFGFLLQSTLIQKFAPKNSFLLITLAKVFNDLKPITDLVLQSL